MYLFELRRKFYVFHNLIEFDENSNSIYNIIMHFVYCYHEDLAFLQLEH